MVLAWHPDSKEPKTLLTVMRREHYQDALRRGVLVPDLSAGHLPPWLSPLEGVNLEARVKEWSDRGKSTRMWETCKERLAAVLKILEDSRAAILESDYPTHAIRERIKTVDGLEKHNRQRLVEWTLAFISYGTVDALYPATITNGRWDRESRPSDVAYFNGGAYFRLRKDDIDKCIAGFESHAVLGKPFLEIYNDTLRGEFKCNLGKVSAGRSQVCHVTQADGNPYPSFDQFRYQVLKKFSLEDVHLKIYGRRRVRQDAEVSKGRFTAELLDYLEKVEYDAYSVTVEPAPECGDTKTTLHVVKIIDVASSCVVGIGFSEGAENSAAYKAAWFSMAVGLDVIGELLGVEVDLSLVPPAGLGPFAITDRGPGAGLCSIAALVLARELTLSGEGQSKATNEAGHPRAKKVDPSKISQQIRTGLRMLESAKAEFIRALASNRGKHLRRPLHPDMVSDLVAPNPISVCNWLCSENQLRTQAHRVDRNQAVREGLDKVKFKVKNDGFYLDDQCFSSNESFDSNLLSQHQGEDVDGYIFPIAVGRVWIELQGRLHELQISYSYQTAEGKKIVPRSVLTARAAGQRWLNKEQRGTRIATDIDMRERFKQNTGLEMDGSGARRRAKAA